VLGTLTCCNSVTKLFLPSFFGSVVITLLLFLYVSSALGSVLTYILPSTTTSFVNRSYVFLSCGRHAGIKVHDFKITSKNAWRYFKICEISQAIQDITNL